MIEGGVCPIKWSSINEFAYRYNIIDSIEFDSFIFFIRQLDNEFRNLKNREIREYREARKSHSPKSNRRR